MPSAKDLGLRFTTVSFLPLLTAAGLVLILVWSGAPQRPPDVHRLEQHALHVGAGAWGLLALLALIGGLVLAPLQLLLVRLLEGYGWRPTLGWLDAVRTRHYRTAYRDLVDRRSDERLSEGEREAAATQLRHRFPPLEARILPTRLGNTLRSYEDRAGQFYELDTVTAWPRLYMLLPEQAMSTVTDARNQLDTACRYCACFAATALVYVGVLAKQGWWLSLALAPAMLAAISYTGAIGAARLYGDAISAAFDLYRLKLAETMGFAAPGSFNEERRTNRAISLWLAQGVPPSGLRYAVAPTIEETST